MRPRRSIDRLVAALVGLLMTMPGQVLLSSQGHADEPDADEADPALAEQAWRDGRFAEAAHRSIEAFRARPRHTVLLYNAARAFHRAQLCSDALRWYRTYLDLADLDAARRDVASQLAEAIASGADLDCPGQDKPVALPMPVTPGQIDAPWPAHGVYHLKKTGNMASNRRFWGWALLGTGTAGMLTGGWLLNQWATARPGEDDARRQRDTGSASAAIGAAAAGLGLWLLLNGAEPTPTSFR